MVQYLGNGALLGDFQVNLDRFHLVENPLSHKLNIFFKNFPTLSNLEENINILCENGFLRNETNQSITCTLFYKKKVYRERYF